MNFDLLLYFCNFLPNVLRGSSWLCQYSSLVLHADTVYSICVIFCWRDDLICQERQRTTWYWYTHCIQPLCDILLKGRFDLSREAAYNLVLIYKGSGSTEMAREIMQKYLVIWVSFIFYLWFSCLWNRFLWHLILAYLSVVPLAWLNVKKH